MFLAIATLSLPALADPAHLLDREPFDQIVLKGNGETFNVYPLKVPRKIFTSLPTDGRLQLVLVDRPGDSFDVSWSNVAEIRLYEQMLLEEAHRLVGQGDFDQAYDYFARLQADYASFPGLNDELTAYLRKNALALHQEKQDERALSLLMSLAERNSADAGLASALESVAGELIQEQLRKQDYAAARAVLDLWQSKFRDVATTTASAWQQRFEAAADRQLTEAARLTDQQRYLDARKAAQRAVAIWPKHRGAADALARIQREFPSVTVGVFETAPREALRRIDSWPALRSGRLVAPNIVEQVGFGTDGGEYRSPLGELVADESVPSLQFKLRSAAGVTATPDLLARDFLAMADPTSPRFRADFASVFAGVSIKGDSTVELRWKRPHVRPEALLEVPPSAGAASLARFAIAEYEPAQVIYAAKSSPPGRLQAVVERTINDDDTAVAALVSGDVDVLDHVPPWQVARLRSTQHVRVAAYRLPSVHVLIPNQRNELMNRREFRRALSYGIDRQWILDRVILGGASDPAFSVVSGPFPKGVSHNDPVRYGYNDQVAPRPFEPRLAAILATVAWAGVQKQENKDDKNKDDKDAAATAGELPPLVLAHPNDPLARVACQLIQMQFGREGIKVELRPYTAAELASDKLEYDLRYAQLVVTEPLVDASRILGAGGIAGDTASPLVAPALWRLEAATNWKDVRARMAELHDIAHHDLPVIPLWQTVDYFAYRDTTSGIGDAPVALYQNIDDWRMSGGAPTAQRDSR